jgi:hypothetical protein
MACGQHLNRDSKPRILKWFVHRSITTNVVRTKNASADIVLCAVSAQCFLLGVKYARFARGGRLTACWGGTSRIVGVKTSRIHRCEHGGASSPCYRGGVGRGSFTSSGMSSSQCQSVDDLLAWRRLARLPCGRQDAAASASPVPETCFSIHHDHHWRAGAGPCTACQRAPKVART